jgi:branched-subunit amino acid aminotransferase/4-amino-4-deoxychorismate lyase
MQNSRAKEIIFLNGQFLTPDEAKVSVLTPGLLYGLGLFETMRSYQDKIVYFGAHIGRIKNSCKLLGLHLPYSAAAIRNIIKRAVGLGGLNDAYVRLTLWKAIRGADISVIVKQYQPYAPEKYQKGMSLAVSSLRQQEDNLLARHKTTNRLLYELSLREARNRGFEGALILNSRGYIAEASRSNIFFAKGNAIFTPALACGCLEGITRRVIFDLARKNKLKIIEANFTLRDLYDSDEAFLTNSLAGVMPLASVEKKRIGEGAKKFKLTRFFMKEYSLLLRDGD